jgi:hypothetical protein
VKHIMLKVNLDGANVRSLAQASLAISQSLIAHQEVYGFMPDKGDEAPIYAPNGLVIGSWKVLDPRRYTAEDPK